MILHLSLALLAALTFPQNEVSAGNVGCLFSEELCKSESQWCFDDGAFGRCLDSFDNTPTDDLYRHSLDKVELAKLEMELEKLMESGYRWSHRHTQCVLQALLFSFQTGNDFEKIICDRLKDKDLESALRPSSIEDSDEQRNIAYINYQPSADNPRTDFADEVYYPPDSQSAKYYDRADEEDEENEPYAVVRRSLPDHKWDHFSTLYNTPEHFRSGFELKDLPMSYELPDEKPEGMPYFPVPGPVSFPGQDDYDENDEDVKEKNSPDDDRDLLYIPKGGTFKDNDPSVTGYSEGGVVYFPQGKNDIGRMSKEDILESLGFKRRERLDVKKPGPPYDPAFQTTSSTGQPESVTSVKEMSDEQPDSHNELHLRPAKSMPWPKSKKPQKKVVDETEDSDEYDVVDTTYAYIKFKHDINNWRTASHIVSSVAELLNVPRKIFTQERPDRDEIIFKVNEPNALGLNASEVARRIDTIKEDLRRRHGVVVVSAGIGNKTKLPAMVRLDGRPEHEVYVVTVVVCGVLVALALSAGVLYLTRRHGHKIRNMASSTEEPSKHYQELCRARMSGKTSPNQGQDSGSTAPAQRIASLSKESDKDSGSSRSSTSSWTEEPALTNMDVATGQMVLSYMEEHLKNKDRLDSEWAALCAYEADPSATTIAQRPENLQKNRYPHALPYDHARVVLNELSNITGSDYINASTITDHDPRNAAYIVTQGPLPHTAPDLWQMVWEQGCVVMVMLTRLGDGDTSLCHRYWPEEGSELYHIYEVHLVSEHIWCDDYLVRSFYLKNLKTGETRTVTQFHFLSWTEGGVPASTKPLLEFRRKVNKSFRGRSCPIVVHCSDGVGRSGAYCLLDMVLNRMAKGAKEIDIAATLEHVRDQRAGAVATKQQFQFVLSAVADEVQALLKVLPQQ